MLEPRVGMGVKPRHSWLSPFLLGFLGACCLLTLYNTFFGSSVKDTIRAQVSVTPGMDYIDAYRCTSGEDKLVMMRGKEDNFSREGDEPANISSELLESPFYRDLASDSNNVYGFRDYDERGVDKFLFDYFEVPDGLVEGYLLLVVAAQGNIDSDAISLGNFANDFNKAEYRSQDNFSSSLTRAIEEFSLADDSDVIVIPQSAFQSKKPEGTISSLPDYLKRKDRRKGLDLYIQDDAMVDFSALVLCTAPAKNKGTTFTEMSSKRFGPHFSYLGCNMNKSQAMCDPFAGDLLCSKEAPLGCYRDGSARLPDTMANDFPRRHFVGGTVRVTDPVRGDRFRIYTDAAAYCRAQFGPEWRVLNFHEAGGTAIATKSDIEVNTRIWVDVSDQAYSNCWSRE